MNNRLRYISISHKYASLHMREQYHFSDTEKKLWAEKIRSNFKDISGLLILVTCNRTELYFESEVTGAAQLRDFIIDHTDGQKADLKRAYFAISDDTQETVHHILEVSSGLASSVLGDAEIIHQIKMAYWESCHNGMQGSLLERCMQSVFKGHKRISNETGFRDGTTSVAYKTLKLIASTFDSTDKDALNILFIGAGDIVKQLLNYNNKFGFKSVFVANRTAKKAEELTRKFGGKTYSWDRVLANDFKKFQVIVTAVSNCPGLVRQVEKGKGHTLLLDLAVPGNIDKRLKNEPHVIHYNLDTIAKALKENHESRMKSISQVDSIIQEELQEYLAWLNDAPVRNFLASYKKDVNQWVTSYLQLKGHAVEDTTTRLAVNRIVRQSFKQQGTKVPEREMELIVEEYI